MEKCNIRKSGMNNLLQKEKTQPILGEFLIVKKGNLHEVWNGKFQYFCQLYVIPPCDVTFQIAFRCKVNLFGQ